MKSLLVDKFELSLSLVQLLNNKFNNAFKGSFDISNGKFIIVVIKTINKISKIDHIYNQLSINYIIGVESSF